MHPKPTFPDRFADGAGQWEVHLPDLTATQALGESIGNIAKPGLVVALVGELGAGKTSLVQGLAKGWGCPIPVR